MDASDLESALNNAKKEVTPTVKEESVSMSRDEEVGFHKGALNTLVAERNELVKMVGNVEAIMQAHISRLKDLGVNMNG